MERGNFCLEISPSSDFESLIIFSQNFCQVNFRSAFFRSINLRLLNFARRSQDLNNVLIDNSHSIEQSSRLFFSSFYISHRILTPHHRSCQDMKKHEFLDEPSFGKEGSGFKSRPVHTNSVKSLMIQSCALLPNQQHQAYYGDCCRNAHSGCCRDISKSVIRCKCPEYQNQPSTSRQIPIACLYSVSILSNASSFRSPLLRWTWKL